MTRKNRIAEQWRLFEKVLPKDAPAVQIREMRRAFYAGANGLLVSILTLLEPGMEATDSDLAMLDDIQQEFKDFAADIAAGSK